MTALTLRSVNVGRAVRIAIGGRRVLTAIGKQPVRGTVGVLPLGLEGDEQADRALHGGLAKAVYAYGVAQLAFWQQARAAAGVAPADHPVPPGGVGENLTVDGLDEAACFIGDHWLLPGCVLEVSEPRMPCAKFQAVMGFAQASKMMARLANCGAYLSVREPGRLCAGERIEVAAGPRRTSVRDAFLARAGKLR